jgi:tellurite resistance protein
MRFTPVGYAHGQAVGGEAMLLDVEFRVYYRTVAGGVFHCERCGGDRPYGHRSGRRWAVFLGLPIFPLDRAGDHLRCAICRTCYRVELLAVPTIEQMHAALLAATTAAALAMLNAGGSASPAARHRAIELITTSGSPEYGEQDLEIALASCREAPDALDAPLISGSVPALRSVVETFAIQLESRAREWFLGGIVQVGLADGSLSPAERDVACMVARYLGMSQARADGVIQLAEEAAQAGLSDRLCPPRSRGVVRENGRCEPLP